MQNHGHIVVQDYICKFYDERGHSREERVIASGSLMHAAASARCVAHMIGVSAFEVWQHNARLHHEQSPEWRSASREAARQN